MIIDPEAWFAGQILFGIVIYFIIGIFATALIAAILVLTAFLRDRKNPTRKTKLKIVLIISLLTPFILFILLVLWYFLQSYP